VGVEYCYTTEISTLSDELADFVKTVWFDFVQTFTVQPHQHSAILIGTVVLPTDPLNGYW
jgi:hypothetical protein